MKTIEMFMNYGYGKHVADWILLLVVLWITACMLLRTDKER